MITSVEAKNFSAMRGHVADGVVVIFRDGSKAGISAGWHGWDIVADDGGVISGPHRSAMSLECAIVAHDLSLEARG